MFWKQKRDGAAGSQRAVERDESGEVGRAQVTQGLPRGEGSGCSCTWGEEVAHWSDVCWRGSRCFVEGPRWPGALWEAVGLQGGCSQQGTGYARGEVCPVDEDRRVVGIQETAGSLVPLRPFRKIVWIGKQWVGAGASMKP